MGRRHRIQAANAKYHVTTRGNNRGPIFADDFDRQTFLVTLQQTKLRHGWKVHAYCLMDNHYHLLLETPKPNIGAGMRWLNGVYSHRLNDRHGRIGHSFQRRYADGHITDNDHLREVVRYIPLNPVRAGVAKHPDDYRWSSYRATLGLERRPRFLTVHMVLDLFDNNLGTARELYRDWVQEGRLRPRKQPHQEPLSTIFRPGRSVNPDDICRAREQGYSLSEIARHLGVSHTTVRRKMAKRM
jgi:putative transposase